MKPRCSAKSSRTGERCRCWPMKGQKVCANHGGKAPRARAAATRRLELVGAEKAVQTYGLPADVEPLEAILGELHRTAGHVHWLGAIVGQLPDAMESTMFGQQVSVWIKAYREERSHLVAVAKACLTAGIEERRVRLAEKQAELIATAFRGFAVDLGHDPADPAVRAAFRRHLTMIEGGSAT